MFQSFQRTHVTNLSPSSYTHWCKFRWWRHTRIQCQLNTNQLNSWAKCINCFPSTFSTNHWPRQGSIITNTSIMTFNLPICMKYAKKLERCVTFIFLCWIRWAILFLCTLNIEDTIDVTRYVVLQNSLPPCTNHQPLNFPTVPILGISSQGQAKEQIKQQWQLHVYTKKNTSNTISVL